MISSHKIAAAVVVGNETIPLTVMSARVGLDEAWSPYVQAELTCALPDLDDFDVVDPRQVRRVRIRLVQQFGSSSPVSAITADGGGSMAAMTALRDGLPMYALSALYGTPFNAFGIRASTRRSLDLTLRGREIDHRERTMTLTAESDEALLWDYRLMAATAESPGSTSVRAVVNWVLARFGAVLVTGTDDGTVTTDSTAWQPGQSAWEYLRPLVETAGLRLWCDEARNWHLTVPTPAATGALSLSSTRLTSATDSLDRDGDWCDAVVIRYRWVDGAGATQTAYDTAAVGGWSKVVTLEWEKPYPGPGAAAAILARYRGRGRAMSVDVVSDYGATPGQPLTVVLPSTPVQTGLVSAVSWRVPEDEMSIRSRDLIDTPPNSWLFIPAGYAWNEIAAGVDWTELDFTEA